MDPSSSSDSNETTISDNVPDVVDNTTITTTVNGSNENQPSDRTDSNINTITTPNTTTTNGGDNASSDENQVTTSSENKSSSTNVDDQNTTTPTLANSTSTENIDDPTNSISADSQKQLIRSGSVNRPRKALPRPSHHAPSHSSIDFSFENSNIHQALEKSTHFVIDTSSPHLDDNAATATTATTTTTNTGTTNTTASVQITTTSDSPTATTTTLTSSTSGHHLTSNMTTTQQRRMSHKRSSSDVSGLFGNSSLVSNSTTVASPVTPEKQDSSAPRKKFTLFGFSFGGKSSSNLHSMAPSIPSNSTTPTLANSPITSSSTNTLPTTPIAERGISSLTTTSTDQCITPTTSTLSTTSSSEDSAEIMRKKRASDDVSQEVLKYLSDKPPNRATTIGDEETLKKRQGMHMSQPIGTLGTPEDSNIVGERASRREIDLINFLGEMNLNQSGSYDDTSSTGSRSGMDDIRVATTPESREQTTYGFKSFLDKVRNKAIFARGVGSPADEALTPSSITTDSKTEEDAKSDITTTTTKTPKKLSEKELRKIKLMERETNQKEMMDGVLDKISKNGESFAHLTFFDENDQEWQYIGYIQKYDSSMTDDELYMMYALLGVGGAEEGSTPKTKEKDVKDFTGGIFGDACVCPVLSRLCGRGELRYPNGAIYEGDIIRGKRHGFGKMIFPYKNTLPPPSGKKSSNTEQAPPTAIAIGQWVLNNPSEAIPFKVTYSNELEYWGTFRSKSKFNSAYVISVGDLEKHKEGELYHVQENKKYFGGFSEDLKDGFGVEVMGNGERYYGGWKNGLYHHMGTYQYIDGSYFQGEFKRGCRKGKGKLYLATGDVIEGTWNGDKIENAVFKKGNCKNVELTHLFQLRTQVNDAIKLFQNVGHMDDSNYLQFLRMTKKESIERPELELKWKYYSLMSKETWRKEKTHLLEYYSKNGDKCNLLDKIVFKNEVIKILGETIKTEYISPQVSFVKGFIEFFDSLYHGSYYAGNNRNQSSGARKVARKENGVLLYNAIDDLKSFIIFLCDQVVWEFFGNEIISAKLGSLSGGSDNNLEQQDGQYDDYDDEIIFGSTMPATTDITKSHFTTVQQAYNFCKTIIADHLHKKLYSTTFELYEYHFRDQDLMINQKINSILTTCSLQNFGVHSDFIPKDVKPYNDCIQLMKEIKFSNSVESKIRVLSKLRTLVMHSMKNVKLESKKLKKRLSGELDYENVESDDWQPGADDVTSLYTFSFIKTNLGNYTALFNYVNDWKSPHTSLKPVSHVISFFEGFLAYIMDLDPNLTVKQSELGESIGDGSEDSYVYISKYGLTKQLERAIELAIFRNQSKKEKIERQMQKPNLEPSEMKELTHQQKELQLISFSWVSPLLLFASLQVGHIQLQVNKKAEATQSETTKALAIEVVETTHQNMIVPMVDGSGNMLNLAQALVKYHSLVQSVLESAKLGFNIALKSDKKEGSQATTTTEEKVHHNERIVIEFDKEPFPSYVYSELSLEIAKFIKFELENSDSHQYKI